MKPGPIEGKTRTLAEDQEAYFSLQIRDEKYEDGSNVMYSAWTPTAKELEALNNGGRVMLGILGSIHPPVIIKTIGPLDEEKADRRPARCRFRLADEGLPHPKSSCFHCGRTIATGLGKKCNAEPKG